MVRTFTHNIVDLLKALRGVLVLILMTTLGLNAQVTKSIYFVGNSVTDAINYAGLDALAESRGNTHIWGRHMIPGAPLSWIWDHPTGGISESPYGYYPNALANHTWNVLSLQPFDRPLLGADGDATMAGNFINSTTGRSPQVQVYIYSRWPRKQPGYGETAASFNQLWTRTYGSAGPTTEETADYFVKLTNQLRANHTNISPVRMVPVGQVFHALNNKMANGQVPGYSHIWQVYSDNIHTTGTGSYIAAITYYATLYGQSPVGLSVPSQFGTISPDVARIIQETAWDIVRNEPLSGVTCTSNCNPVDPVLKPAENPTGTVAGLNYSYYEGAWTSLPGFSSLTAAETGRVPSYDMSVRNRTDNYALQYTGYINVPADGTYTFYTSSDDGSKLYIGTTQVVNNDGLHAIQERSGTIGLKAGKHSITVTFFEATGGEGLTVSYAGPGLTKQVIPGAALSSIPVNTTNNPPTAVLNATPTSGSAPLNVSFNATGSNDPDAGDFILGYEWNFGDGSATNNSNAPTHIYTVAGTYTVTLRVMDNRSLYSSPVTRNITVSGGSSGSNKYEAESAVLSGTTVSNLGSGFSGTGYVTGLDGNTDKLTFTVNVPTAGSYPLAIRYQNSCGACEKWQNVKVNTAAAVYTQFLPASAGWNTKNYGNISLNAGNNTIEISKSWGWSDFDYITVGGSGARLSAESLTETKSSSLDEAVSVYPNPVRGNVLSATIHSDEQGEAAITLLSVSSQKVIDRKDLLKKGTTEVNIPVAHLTNGLHFLIIKTTHARVVKKVLIDR